ncbi:hypothetical protein M3484_08420 [Pseudomonas sp. GX19020]|uniref:hypothetical protein n=1 Tax=Pseudomonas sp. GX19020 TaxID=2942277 RepID=UPI0020199444|nr:hypothetical protein [Pseudomonas sp. GX19020]MCL4066595.1 hypothetical protein [Pseudomonas sp. GX19020]
MGTHAKGFAVMTTIPKLGIRLFDPDQTPDVLCQRFLTHLATLRSAKDPELAGKPLRPVIITAVARKLITTANALCKTRQKWAAQAC